MKNNIMKRVASCVCAFAFALAAIVLPLRVTQSENVAASAETTFTRADIYLPFLSFSAISRDYSVVVNESYVVSLDYDNMTISLGYGDMYNLTAIDVVCPIVYGSSSSFHSSYTFYESDSGVIGEVGYDVSFMMYRSNIVRPIPDYYTVSWILTENGELIYYFEFYVGDDDDAVFDMNLTFVMPIQADFVVAPLLGYTAYGSDCPYFYFDCGVLPFNPYLSYQGGVLKSYQDGYRAGQLVGETQGYAAGYQDGLNDALEDGGTLTFRSLISAVIDVPLNAFRSLFSFDILGVDMLTFFSSLLTLGIILAVVRLIF